MNEYLKIMMALYNDGKSNRIGLHQKANIDALLETNTKGLSHNEALIKLQNAIDDKMENFLQ